MKNRKLERNIDSDKNEIESMVKDIAQLIFKISMVGVIVIFLFSFVYGITRTNDVSMKPAVKDGDLVLFYRLDHRFVSGDVAVFQKNGRTTTARVVAVAGDTVNITKDGLVINGAAQISQDIYFDTTQFQSGIDFPITVGKDQVFVLGDNRPVANDSRMYGCIDIKDIKGKMIAVIRTRGI